MIRNYLVHNILAHPAMEILHRLGLHGWADYMHDRTLPKADLDVQPPSDEVAVIDPADLPNILAGNGHWRDYTT